ncbi:MAG TPA: archaeal heat shock protein Hsp14 [Nitrososphaeraceae archaeon]|nr:archaeal heat shock protein Hsp14 [Nitrososphaeraceae archaeon]
MPASLSILGTWVFINFNIWELLNPIKSNRIPIQSCISSMYSEAFRALSDSCISEKGFISIQRKWSMGLGQYMAKEVMRELGNRSKEFYEFIMPAIDIVEDGNDLLIIIDLPGFAKKDIKLRIVGDILSINAKREPEENIGTVYYRQRPSVIEKKVTLPISVSDDEKVVGTANYVDGVVTLRVPIPMSGNIPVI